MKRFLCFLCLLFAISMYGESGALRKYNIVWRSPSKDALDSMPLSGRHGAGANVWVQDGTIWIYLGHSGAFDSQGRLLKLGCIRLTLPGIHLGEEGFSQMLDLESGTIYITQGNQKVNLWFADETLVIETKNSVNSSWEVAYATWRDVNRQAVLQDMNGNKGDYTADHIEYSPAGIVWYHKNADEFVDLKAKALSQGIPLNAIDDVTSERLFGGALTADGGLSNFKVTDVNWQCWNGKAWIGHTVKAKKHLMTVSLGAGVKVEPATWLAKARDLLGKKQLSAARKEEMKRWANFWSRSFVQVQLEQAGNNDEGFKIGRNYQLFRYMLACNRDGEFPLLFNGGIFTVDNIPHRITGNNNNELPIWEEGVSSPDFRRWMNCHFMSQNQRWLGRPTLASGDRDLLEPSLKFYRDRMEVAAARARINGAIGVVYPEPMDIWGLCCVAPLANGLCGAQHLTYHFSMMLDQAWMALEAHSILGVSIAKDLKWIVGTILFYDSYYRAENRRRTGKELGADGKLVLFPTNTLEFASGAVNAVDAVCGMKRITAALLSLPELEEDTRRKLETILPTIPDIPVGVREGKTSILPAVTFENQYNIWEPAEMVAAYPYKLVGVTHPETLQLLRDTYASVPQERAKFCMQDYSWMPNVANVAAMADVDEARKRVIYKMANTEAPQARFPAFFGPGHDWMPDHNWGGSGMVGIQEMLVAADPYGDGKIYLLPAWPREWSVNFKLHAPSNTVIECSYSDGKIQKLKVTPEYRLKDVVVMLK